MAVATSALEKSMCRKIVLSLAVIDSCASAAVLSNNSDVGRRPHWHYRHWDAGTIAYECAQRLGDA